MKALTYIEIDVDFCSNTYGSAPCTASIPTTGDIKCFNTIRTCQDRVNFVNAPATLRYSLEGRDYQPASIEAIPCVVGVSMSPGQISLGENLGVRSSVSITFRDFRHSDTGSGGDPYLSTRTYDPYTQGTYFGKFRSRQTYLQGRPLRLYQGFLGQSLAEMTVRHYVVEQFTGPTNKGLFQIVAKDVLKLADNDRSQAPYLSQGRLSGAITDTATALTLSPSTIGDTDYPYYGYVCIGGKEVSLFGRVPNHDHANVALLLHFDGSNGSTTFTDSSPNAYTVTRNGGPTIATAQSVFGGASGTFDGTDDYLNLAGPAGLALAAGDFTISLRARPTTTGAARVLYDSRPSATQGLYPTIRVNASNVVEYFTDSAVKITGTTALAANTWYTITVCRVSGTTRLFVNGTQEGSSYTDANTYLNGASRPTIATNGNSVTSDEWTGFIDELFVLKGTGLYDGNHAMAAVALSASSSDSMGLVRARLNTTAIAHNADDRVQEVLAYVSQDPADILYDLLANYANIDTDFLPLSSWQTETSTYLNRLYTAYITEPTGVNKLCSELIEQCALAMWWDDTSQLIRMQVLRGVAADVDVFDAGSSVPEGNVIEGTLIVREQPAKRISEVWTYFDRRDPTKKLDDLENYRSVALTVDLQRATDYGSIAIKKILSRWVPSGGRSIALRLNDIFLARFADPPRLFELELFRTTDVSLGGGYRVGGWSLQDATGAAELADAQCVRLDPRDDKNVVALEEILFDLEPEDLNARVVVVDTDRRDFNLRDAHDLLYPEIVTVGSITLLCIVDEAVIVGSSSTLTPAFDVGTFPSGLPITVRVRGRIQGAAGAGGSAGPSPTAGGAGGTALYTRQAITLDLTEGDAEVWGGGGGGSARYATFGATTGVGGGGGAGDIGGAFGPSYNMSSYTDATAGTSEVGGSGGTSTSLFGGAGGGPGAAGSLGYGSIANDSGVGAAGNAIDGDSYCTITGTGDVLGPTIN